MNGFIRNLTSHMSVLIVEHHMDVVMSVCDRLYVLNFGEVISSGVSEDVRRDRSGDCCLSRNGGIN
jgi:branched-chain amino acid transport system ATP-binding protein